MSYLNKFAFTTVKVHDLSINHRCSVHSVFAQFLAQLIIGVLYPKFINVLISYHVHEFVLLHHGTILPNDEYARQKDFTFLL